MLPDVQKEVEVARWLRDADDPAARLADVVEEPVVVDGHPVTFWHLVEVAEPKPSPADLGRSCVDSTALRFQSGYGSRVSSRSPGWLSVSPTRRSRSMLRMSISSNGGWMRCATSLTGCGSSFHPVRSTATRIGATCCALRLAMLC